MDKLAHTVVELKAFQRQANAEGMTESELSDLITFVSRNPEAGDLIVGSGGCRKLRFAKSGGGRSGGYRVVTLFEGDDGQIYLIAVLAKGSRANFSAAEVAAMSAFAKAIKAARRKAG
jgi:hypothetical protein